MTVKGIIFDIKRFAVHDGPGIRTTLFLKGCPLRCCWCHNPEGLIQEPQLAYYSHKCINCGECVTVCPTGAHDVADRKHIFLREKCTACGQCEATCLGKALKLYGCEISVETAVEMVLDDKAFYKKSGGGCTLSGGEPLLQAEFCVEVFKVLKSKDIHCAIDTCGSVGWDCFEKVLPYTDMFLFDLKQIDAQSHIEYVGRSNKLILENLRKLSQQNVSIEIRIPVIPGFNSDKKSIAAFGEFLSGLDNITTVKLLAYHDLARSKFTALGLDDTMPKVDSPTKAQMAEFVGQLQGFVLNAKF